MNGKSFKEYQEKKYEFYHLLIDSKRIFGALIFLIKSFKETGHNPKPVIFHSIKVALLLFELGYGEDIIISALLHDLIEDTDITYEQIASKFGKNIAEIVQALSFNENISDRSIRDMDEVNRALSFGHDAIVIKAADFIDNSNFYYLTGKELQTHLFKKYKYFLKKSEPVIGKEEIYKYLKNNLEKIKNSSECN